MCVFLRGQPRPLFHLFLVFTNKQQINVKMPIQYLVLGFELKTKQINVTKKYQTLRFTLIAAFINVGNIIINVIIYRLHFFPMLPIAKLVLF